MKVIAKVNDNTFLCEVKHTELEKFMGLYYGKMDRLHTGKEIDLAAGYNHAAEIRDAVSKMDTLVTSCEKVTQAVKIGRAIKNKVIKAAKQEASK